MERNERATLCVSLHEAHSSLGRVSRRPWRSILERPAVKFRRRFKRRAARTTEQRLFYAHGDKTL